MAINLYLKCSQHSTHESETDQRAGIEGVKYNNTHIEEVKYYSTYKTESKYHSIHNDSGRQISQYTIEAFK